MFGILSYVAIHVLIGKARKIDKMMWILSAMMIDRCAVKFLL